MNDLALAAGADPLTGVWIPLRENTVHVFEPGAHPVSGNLLVQLLMVDQRGTEVREEIEYANPPLGAGFGTSRPPAWVRS